MSLIIPNSSEQHLLKIIVSATRPATLYLHLYANDPDITNQNLLITDLREANLDENNNFVLNGYGASLLNSANWTISTDINGITTAEHTPVNFNFIGDAVPTIYGYWIESSGNPAFGYSVPYTINPPTSPLFVERFDNPFMIPVAGSNITITPKIKLGVQT